MRRLPPARIVPQSVMPARRGVPLATRWLHEPKNDKGQHAASP
jgi:hypothetical protein